MSLKYQAGEAIIAGDKVRLQGQLGVVEFVVDPTVPDPGYDWYAQKFRSGIMVAEPKVFGCVFISDTEGAEDLVLVSRSEKQSQVSTSDRYERRRGGGTLG